MKKKKDKFENAAHIKKHTVGTSNEISFSVLDAAKNELGEESGKNTSIRSSRLGFISLFTLPLRRKKNLSTPAKELGLTLSTGEFVSSEEGVSRTPTTKGENFTPKKDTPSKAATGSSKPSEKAKTDRREKVPSLGSTLAPQEEISRRKKRRRRQRMAVAALASVIGLCAIGAGTWYLYQEHEKHLDQVGQLTSALDLIKQADETVLEMDRLVANPHDPASISSSNAVLEAMSQARGKLEEANKIAREVSVTLRESKDKEAANQTVLAVNARNALINSGELIILEAQRADSAAKKLQAAWQDVVKADTLARDAALLIVDTTDENVAASKEKSEQASEVFQVAKGALDEIANEFPQIDITIQREYVNKRLESMGYAIASDNAFLEKNKEETIAQNDAYNAADAEAVEMAASFPADMTQPVYAVFERAVEKEMDTYSTARSQAGSADAFLSDYLGTTSK